MKKLFDRYASWSAVVVSLLGMIVLSSISIGKDTRQIEVNTQKMDKLESENKADHLILMNEITDLKIDVGIIADWVKEQKQKDASKD